MSITLSTKTDIVCRACGNKFDHEVWLIVDVNENPELLDPLQNNIINSCLCPACNEFINGFEVPLLVLLQDNKVVFCPPPDTSKIEMESILDGLVDLANSRTAQTTGGLFRGFLQKSNKTIVASNVQVAPREMLLFFIKNVENLLTQEDADILFEKIYQIITCENLLSACRLLLDFPDILNPTTDSVILNLKIEVLQAGQEFMIDAFQSAYDLILQCRFLGIKPAFLKLTGLQSENALLLITGYGLPEDMLQAIRQISPFHEESTEKIREQIKLTKKGLSLLPQKKNPNLWAELNNILGVWLLKLIDENRANNIEEAIRHIEFALFEINKDEFPDTWLLVQNNLGLAYRERINGNRVENLIIAQKHFEKALNECSSRNNPGTWAMLKKNLGIVFVKHHLQRSIYQEKAINCFKDALQIYTLNDHPEDWAMLQVDLGHIYMDRISGNRADNIEKALFHYTCGKNHISKHQNPFRWAKIEYSLGHALVERSLGNRISDIARAIIHLEEALEFFKENEYPGEHLLANSALGHAWTETFHLEKNVFRNGDSQLYLEKAIDCYQSVLNNKSLENLSRSWGIAHDNLGLTKIELAKIPNIDHNRKSQYLEDAASHFKRALTAFDKDTLPIDWAGTHHNLGNAYRNLAMNGKEEFFHKALFHYEQALTVFHQDTFPIKNLLTQRVLGDLYFNNHMWADATSSYYQAIASAEQLFNLAGYEKTKLHEIENSRFLFSDLAYSLLKEGKFNEALEIIDRGKARLISEKLVINERNLDSINEDDRNQIQKLLSEINELEGQLRESPFPTIDITPTVDKIRTSRENLVGLIAKVQQKHPSLIQKKLNYRDIISTIPQNSVLVVITVTEIGLAVILIPHGAKQISQEMVFFKEDFTLETMQNLFKGTEINPGWFQIVSKAQNVTNNGDRDESLVDFSQHLWELLMGPIYERIQALKLKSVERVIIMPHSGLGSLPLHAAWRYENNQVRTFLHDYAVVYAPSGNVFGVSQDRAAKFNKGFEKSLLSVVNPTEDLHFATAEGEAVSSYFLNSKQTCLVEKQATKSSVLDSISECTFLHFACHGAYDWTDVMRSELLLANDTSLTLSDILKDRLLKNNRLVVLSACETGITKIRRTPDEYLGFSSAFLQAGAAAVVSTLWAVNDVATMLLMERFYKLHLQDELSPGDALQQAQLWLRHVTAGELEKRFEAEFVTLSNRMTEKTSQ